MNVAAAMAALAELLQPHVSRLVTPDPTRTGNTPCVLIDLPEIDPTTAQLCGQMMGQFPVYVIGQPGAFPEIKPLSALLAEVVAALDTVNLGYTRMEPVEVPLLNESGAADPCVGYRITVERYI